jgi:hypothetical protein
MKIVVFGVTHWDNEKEFQTTCSNCNKTDILFEWYNRVFNFIPNPYKVFLAAGSESNPALNPLPIDLYQIYFKKIFPYSNQNLYFRLGFMTGIWKALLDFPDFDLLIHVQATRYLGKDLTPYLREFLQRDEQVMACNYKSQLPEVMEKRVWNIMDIGFMAMKKPAALMYAATGYRQSCDPNLYPITAEEEALLMFKDSWWNPFPEIPTIRQRDLAYETLCENDSIDFKVGESQFEITDIEYFKTLPIIANGKHVTKEFLDAWLAANPCKL